MTYKMGIDRPFLNDYCEKCVSCRLQDGDEARCTSIKMGMSDVMCVQVVKCHNFIEKEVKKDG
jgi:hypothetical protein